MKNALRLAIAALVGTSAFFATVLGIEFVTWWWTAPADPLADPAVNAFRFVTAAAVGLGLGYRVLPRPAGPRPLQR